MTFPASQNTYADAYNNLRNQILTVQSYALLVQNTLTNSPPVTSSTVLNLLSSAVTLQGMATTIQNTTGLLAGLESYMSSITGQTTTAIGTELSAALNAANNLVTAIIADYPVDSNGFLADRKFSSNQVAAIGLTAAQLPNTTTAITAWLAAIQ